MAKLENISPPLLKRVDELLIWHHPFLQKDDEVYYLGEYTNGKLADHSPVNELILNYKKELKWKGKSGWIYKENAIKTVAEWFRCSIFHTDGFAERLKNSLLSPVPPHKTKDDPDFDNRNLKMLQYFNPTGNIYEIVVQKNSREALHKSKNRDVNELMDNYFINHPNQNSKFNEIWIFDDILRNGTHFRAIKNLLKDSYVNVKIVGFFIARSVNH
jgi:hypothetical protein